MSLIEQKRTISLRDAFLKPLEASEGFSEWDRPRYTRYAQEMSCPAYEPWSGKGFYAHFWPRVWEPVIDAIKGACEKQKESAFLRYEAGPLDIWGSMIFSVPAEVHESGAHGQEDVEVREIDTSYGWKYPGLEFIPEPMLDWLREAQGCLANFMPLPLELISVRRSCVKEMPDVFFEMVRRWYLEDELYSTDESYCRVHADYFGQFGEGEAGWINFVDQNYLLGNFVNEDYSVRELFDRGADILEDRGSFPKDEHDVAELVRNIADCWEKRAESLAQVYEEKPLDAARKYGQRPRKDAEDSLLGEASDELYDLYAILELVLPDNPADWLLQDLIDAAGAKRAVDLLLEDPMAFTQLSAKYDQLRKHGEVIDFKVAESLQDLAAQIDGIIESNPLYAVYFDQESQDWRLRGTHESEPDLTYIVCEFCRTCFIYEFDYEGDEPHYYEGERYYHHRHDFAQVLCAVLDDPLRFYIPDEWKDEYSKQELDLIECFKNKLLEGKTV